MPKECQGQRDQSELWVQMDPMAPQDQLDPMDHLETGDLQDYRVQRGMWGHGVRKAHKERGEIMDQRARRDLQVPLGCRVYQDLSDRGEKVGRVVLLESWVLRVLEGG